MSTTKARKWAAMSNEEKDIYLMQMRVKEALRNQTDLYLAEIDEIAEMDYNDVHADQDKVGNNIAIVLMALADEGYNRKTMINIVRKAFQL